MSHWSLVPEFISLLFIIVIMLFFYDKHRVRTFRRSLFWGCLWTSIISILLNVAGAYLIAYPHLVSLEFNTLINTLYFWSTVLMCSVVAMYLFHKMLEYVYDKFIVGSDQVWNLSSWNVDETFFLLGMSLNNSILSRILFKCSIFSSATSGLYT